MEHNDPRYLNWVKRNSRNIFLLILLNGVVLGLTFMVANVTNYFIDWGDEGERYIGIYTGVGLAIITISYTLNNVKEYIIKLTGENAILAVLYRLVTLFETSYDKYKFLLFIPSLVVLMLLIMNALFLFLFFAYMMLLAAVYLYVFYYLYRRFRKNGYKPTFVYPLIVVSLIISFLVIFTLMPDMSKKYLFDWDKVPGTDNDRLSRFLMNDYKADWVENALIIKSVTSGCIHKIFYSNACSYINVSSKNHYVFIYYNGTIQFDDGRTDELAMMTENGKYRAYSFHPYYFFINLSVYMLFPGLTTTIIILLLPKRKRIFGKREVHFPYAIIGIALWVIGFFSFAYAFIGVIIYRKYGFLGELLPENSDDIFSMTNMIVLYCGIGVLLWYIGEYCYYLDGRMKAPTMEQVICTDNRPPVLYLRAFCQESEYFVAGLREDIAPKEKLELYTLNPTASTAEYTGITFEQYFSKEVNNTLGPLIALGNPEDYIAPEGAFRIYADDKDWMEHFKDFSQRAVCILVEVGKSKNLQLELDWLKKAELQEKLFVITSPRQYEYKDHSVNYIGCIYLKVMRKIKGLDFSWRGFADGLYKVGYFVSTIDPGPGSVLTFNKECKGILLTTDARVPSEFIIPIKEWIQKRKYLQIWSHME